MPSFPWTLARIMMSAVSIFLMTYELEVGHNYLHSIVFCNVLAK